MKEGGDTKHDESVGVFSMIDGEARYGSLTLMGETGGASYTLPTDFRYRHPGPVCPRQVAQHIGCGDGHVPTVMLLLILAAPASFDVLTHARNPTDARLAASPKHCSADPGRCSGPTPPWHGAPIHWVMEEGYVL